MTKDFIAVLLITFLKIILWTRISSIYGLNWPSTIPDELIFLLNQKITLHQRHSI